MPARKSETASSKFTLTEIAIKRSYIKQNLRCSNLHIHGNELTVYAITRAPCMLFYTDKAHAKHMRDPRIRKRRCTVGWLLGVVWCSYYCWYPPPILFPTLLQFRWITQGCPGICSWLAPLMAWLACLHSDVISTIHWQPLTWIFWVTLKINLWRDNSVVLINKMHTDTFGQNTILLL